MEHTGRPPQWLRQISSSLLPLSPSTQTGNSSKSNPQGRATRPNTVRVCVSVCTFVHFKWVCVQSLHAFRSLSYLRLLCKDTHTHGHRHRSEKGYGKESLALILGGRRWKSRSSKKKKKRRKEKAASFETVICVQSWTHMINIIYQSTNTFRFSLNQKSWN